MKTPIRISLFIFTLSFFSSAFAAGTISLSGEAKSPKEILSFVHNVKSHPIADDSLACITISTIQNTILCLSNTNENLDDYFARASAYIEGDKEIKIGTLLSQKDSLLQSYREGAAGYDLKKADLDEYHSTAASACAAAADMCETKKEIQLKNLMNRANSPIVIALSLDDEFLVEHISHEVLHALYFANPKYFEVLSRFWNDQIHPTDKQGITWFLSNQYDVSDFDLVMNEFFAFLLQKPIPRSLLSGYLDEYKSAMTNALISAGLEIWIFE